MEKRASGRTTEATASLDEQVASDPARRASGVQQRAARSEPSALSGAAPAGELPLVSIGSPPDPGMLEPTSAYLSAYCSACLPPRVAERVNVAVYELLANALRYGSPAGEVRVELRRAGRGVELSVENSAEPEAVARLRAQLARVKAGADAAFQAEMSRLSGEGQPAPMLGLVRVAHECGLSLELSAGAHRVRISTLCRD